MTRGSRASSLAASSTALPFMFGLSLLTLGSNASNATARPLDLLLGHFEIHSDYRLTPGQPDAGWQFSVSYSRSGTFLNQDSGVVRLPPESTRLVAAPATRQAIDSRFARLGAEGSPFWLLPQNLVPGTLFLGVRNIAPNEAFQSVANGVFIDRAPGGLTMSLKAVTGSGPARGGHFAMNSAAGFGFQWHFDTSDGITSADRVEPFQVGAHAHYNWAMTQPGTYAATFEFRGKLRNGLPDGGTLTAGEATFHFVVPLSGTAPSGSTIVFGTGEDGQPATLGLVAPPTAAIVNPGEKAVYAPDRVALLAEPVVRSGSLAAAGNAVGAGYQVELPLTMTSPSDVLDWIGLPEGGWPSPEPDPAWASPPLEILRSLGPGDTEVTLQSQLPEVPTLLIRFSEAGIYRLLCRPRFTTATGTRLGAVVTLTILAGLPVDYGYDAWRDSFERTHGLPDGALSDPLADWDGDGASNGLEYLLFWHGMDPAEPDGHRVVRWAIIDDQPTPTFLRDTYKDRLGAVTANDDAMTVTLRLRPAASAELETWHRWPTSVTTDPLGHYETTAEPSPGLGRMMARRLLPPAVDALTAPESRAVPFFRLEVENVR